jgi:hypothetical protein
MQYIAQLLDPRDRVWGREQSEIAESLAAPVANPLIVTGIHALATELIWGIFRYCVWSHDEDDASGRIRTLLGLTWVCSRWRNAALAEKSFWAGTASLAGTYKRAKFLTWVARAASKPLDMTVTEAHSSGGNALSEPLFVRHLKTCMWDVMNPSMPVALQTFHASVRTRGTYEAILVALFSSPGGAPLQKLQQVSIHRLSEGRCGAGASAPHTHDRTLLPPTANLADVVQPGIIFLQRKSNDRLLTRSSDLSSLYLIDSSSGAIDAGLLRAALASCPNLTELRLEGILPHTQPDADRPPVVLKRLRKLHFERIKCWEEPGHGVFGLMETPNVEDLAVVDMPFFDLQAYLFSQRDACPRVRVLRLERLGFDNAVPYFVLARWLAGMRLVETLHAININHHYLLECLTHPAPIPPEPSMEPHFPPPHATLLPALKRAQLKNMRSSKAAIKLMKGRERLGVPIQLL